MYRGFIEPLDKYAGQDSSVCGIPGEDSEISTTFYSLVVASDSHTHGEIALCLFMRRMSSVLVGNWSFN